MTPVANWIFVVGEQVALDWVLRNERMAFRPGVRLAQLAREDRVAVYATRSCWHNPTRDRAQIQAIGFVDGDVVHREQEVGGMQMGSYCNLVLRISLPERQGVPFHELVGRLNLTKGRKHWGPVLRRSLVPLADEDMDVIEAAVARHHRHQTSS